MPAKLYRVKLTKEERVELKEIISKGKAAAHKQTHSRILLLSDENSSDGSKKDKEIVRALGLPITHKSSHNINHLPAARNQYIKVVRLHTLSTLLDVQGVDLFCDRGIRQS